MRANSAGQTKAGQRSLWTEALTGVPTISAEQWALAPGLLRWLVATRVSVLPLTLFSVLFAVVLAEPASTSGWILAVLVLFAMSLAHATNNLINDYVDHNRGLDRNNYFRTQYGVHLLESGVCDARSFMRMLVGTGVSALLLGLLICLLVGGWAYGFAAAGALLVLFYTYPLKHWALGELAVLAPAQWAQTYCGRVWSMVWGRRW